jgi:cytochrome c553
VEAASSRHPIRKDHSPSLAHTEAGALKVRGSKLALQTALLALCLAAAGRAEATNTAFSDQALQAKIQYCTDCHQPSGQGYLGATPIPRLAGQQPEYFKNQLQAFIDRRRVNFFMFKVSHSLTPDMLAALADHFKDLNPQPLGGSPADLVDAGKKIFAEGVPAANVPPCSTCHGPEARGNGQFPRLAGQLYPYIIKVLTSWDTERGQGGPEHPDTSAIMKPIAHNLTTSQIEAVAAYLSGLE